MSGGITANNVRGGEIVKGIVGAVEKMVNCCIKDKKNCFGKVN